jgi:hypothetical protein
MILDVCLAEVKSLDSGDFATWLRRSATKSGLDFKP